MFDLPAEGNRFPLQIYNLKNPESSFQFLAHTAEILDVIVLKCPDGLFSIDLPNKGWVFASHSVDGSIHLFDPLSGFLLISSMNIPVKNALSSMAKKINYSPI